MRAMNKHNCKEGLTRRELLRASTAGATALGAALVLPEWIAAAGTEKSQAAAHKQPASANLYSELLQSWCDGLIARQVLATHEPPLYGGILCPACALIHGRCGDAVYPLLRMAPTTGDARYVPAATPGHEWSEP